MIKTYHPRLPASSAVEVTSNDDLLIEILRRLPIKSLIEFKSVSKQWLSLISSPHFSLRRSASPATGLFIEASKFRNFRSADSNVPEFDFIDLNNPSPRQTALPLRFLTFAGANARIIQSCNGLLLCSNAHNAAQTFYVHNPTTKQYTALPPIPSSPRVYGVALAFDPLKSPHYKVICVTNPKSDPSEFLIGIYSSSSDEGEGWRPSLLGPFNSGFDTLFYRGVFWSGAVHWLSRCGPSLSFDVDEERMRELPMPPFSDVLQGIGRVYGFFGESGDHLHFVKHYLMAGESRLNVYEMKRDCSGWFVKYAVDIFELGDVFPEMVVVLDPDLVPPPDDFHYDDFDFDFFVFCVVRGVVEEGSYLVVNIPGKILRYNLESGTLCKLCDVPFLGIGVDISESTGAHQYIDSLACVDLKVSHTVDLGK